MMGNRPAMLLKSSDDKNLVFDFDKTCGINPKKESHMHALKIRFDDADTGDNQLRRYHRRQVSAGASHRAQAREIVNPIAQNSPRPTFGRTGEVLVLCLCRRHPAETR